MINATSTSQSQKAISVKTKKSRLIEKRLNFDIQLAPKGSEHRNEIETFIKQGFAKTYDAKISISTPYLLALSNGSFKAALGLRSGRDELFIEQYLSRAIEKEPFFMNNNVNRETIVEFSHLFSNAKRFTIPLFMVTAVALFYLDYKYVVFSGTEKVVQLLDNAGVKTTFISEADQTKIQKSTDEWGSYYSTNPKIIAVSLVQIMSLIDGHPLYTKMFEALDDQIAKICLQLC